MTQTKSIAATTAGHLAKVAEGSAPAGAWRALLESVQIADDVQAITRWCGKADGHRRWLVVTHPAGCIEIVLQDREHNRATTWESASQMAFADSTTGNDLSAALRRAAAAIEAGWLFK